MLRAFKSVVSENEEIQRLQDNLDQFLQQLIAYPLIPIGTDNFRIPRPGFKFTTGNTLQVTATANAPVFFFIGNTFYKVTENLLCNLTFNGFAGLDTGALAANTLYYIYAVVKNQAVGLVASKNDPTTAGPVGFPLWSYLGSILSNSTPALENFIYYNGKYRHWNGDSANDVTTQATTLTQQTLKVPPMAKSVFGRFNLTLTVAVNNTGSASPVSTEALVVVRAQSTSDEHDYINFLILEAQKIYMSVSSAASRLDFKILGWDEDPTEFP